MVFTLAANINPIQQAKYFKEKILPVLRRSSSRPYYDCSMYETTDIVDEHRSFRNVRLPEVIRETGHSKSTIYALMDKGEFPHSHKLRNNCSSVGWYAWEIYTFKELEATSSRLPNKTANAGSTPTVDAAAPSQPINGEKTKPRVLPKTKTKLRTGEAGLVITTFKINGHEGEIYLQRGTGKLFGAIGEVPPGVLSLYFSDEFDLVTGPD